MQRYKTQQERWKQHGAPLCSYFLSVLPSRLASPFLLLSANAPAKREHSPKTTDTTAYYSALLRPTLPYSYVLKFSPASFRKLSGRLAQPWHVCTIKMQTRTECTTHPVEQGNGARVLTAASSSVIFLPPSSRYPCLGLLAFFLLPPWSPGEILPARVKLMSSRWGRGQPPRAHLPL